MPIQRQHTNERMSQIVVHNGTVYLAGQVGEDMSAGVEQQTRETLAAIEASAGRGRHRQDSDPLGDHLPEGHRRRLRRHEPRLGPVAAARRRAGARHRRSQALRAGDPGRDVGGRCAALSFVWPGRRAGLFRLMKGARCRTSLKKTRRHAPRPCPDRPASPSSQLSAGPRGHRRPCARGDQRRTHTATARCAVPKRWRPGPMASPWPASRRGLELREAGIRQPILLLEASSRRPSWADRRPRLLVRGALRLAIGGDRTRQPGPPAERLAEDGFGHAPRRLLPRGLPRRPRAPAGQRQGGEDRDDESLLPRRRTGLPAHRGTARRLRGR